MITQEGRTSSQQNIDAEQQLEERLSQFDLWAVSADRSDVCWEYTYPEWPELMSKVKQVMAEAHQSEHSLSLLGRCWRLSEEGEECADWAREHLQETHVQEMVRRLARSAEPRTRWQACDVIGDLLPLNAGAVQALEAGMVDEDPYVRRRAFLPILGDFGNDSSPHLLRMLTDADSCNRYIAVKEARRRNFSTLISAMEAAAQDPEVASWLDHYETHKHLIDQFDK